MNQTTLVQRLTAANRKWQIGLASETLLRAVKVILAALVLAVGIDLIAQLGSWPRLIILILGVGALLGFLGWIAYRAFIKTSPLLPIARLLEERDSRLGTKLINTLQLQEQVDDESKPQLTRDLAARAVEESMAPLGDYDFNRLSKNPKTGKLMLWAAIAGAVVLIPALIWAPISARELLRFLDPFGDHPPFSFTQLEILSPADDTTQVVYHRPIDIDVGFSGHRPKEVFLEISRENSEDKPQIIPLFPSGEDRFVQQIERVDSNLLVRARSKSGRTLSETRRIGVILAPELEGATVSVKAPAYTKIQSRESRIALEKPTAPSLTVLVGSELTFALTSNRPLSEGSISMSSGLPKVSPIPLRPGEGEQAMTASATIIAEESGRLKFDLRDITGLSAEQDIIANLTVTHDLPPKVEITEPLADGFIVANYQTKVGIRSTDDYGIFQTRVHIGVNENYETPLAFLGQVDPPQLDAIVAPVVSPQTLGAIPGDIISIFADVTDIRPEAQMAHSRTLKLEVISEDQYNDYLRLQTEIKDLEDKYHSYQEDLRALAEKQRELAQQAAEAKEGDLSEELRDQLAEAQKQLNEELKALADRMETATRENPLYDLEKELQKVLDEEADAIRKSVAANESALSEFSDSPPGSSEMGEFGEEGEAQANRLDPAREEAEKKIADALEDADMIQELLKSLNDFQQLYQLQQELESQTARYENQPDLGHDDKLALQEMAGTERLVGEGLRQIAENLRSGADRAEEAYPEAAEDARNIAQAIESAGLTGLANKASQSMLAARGRQSHQRAEHLRIEMDKLMSECGACSNCMGDSMSQRLSVMRGMMAGNTFAQMSQCMKSGLSFNPGQSSGGGGAGMAGMQGTGNSQTGQQPPSLLGGESMLGQNANQDSVNSSDANRNDNTQREVVRAGKSGGSESEEVTQVNRDSEAATRDIFAEEYGDIVDAYFNKLTTPPNDQP